MNDFILIFGAMLDFLKSFFIHFIYLLIMIDNLNTILNPKKFSWMVILFEIFILYNLETDKISVNEAILNDGWLYKFILGTVPLYALSILLSELQRNIKAKLRQIRLKKRNNERKIN